MDDSVLELGTALEELEDVLGEVVPDVADTLQPGLTDEQIDTLSVSLRPFHLPQDLRTMYRWHNGQIPHGPGMHRPIFHVADFLPLNAALECYTGWRQALPGWNPLWFPAFGWTDGLLVVLSRGPNDLAGGLWQFAGENPDVSTAFDSIVSLVCTATAAWGEPGHIEVEYLGPDTTMLRDYNPSSIRPDGRPRLTLSLHSSDDWPDDWLAAIETSEPSGSGHQSR